MGLDESPQLMASRLECQIITTESRSHTLETPAESRLNARIHELEMKLIRSGAFTRLDPETILQCVVLLFVFFMFVMIILAATKHHDSDDVKPASQSSQSQTPATQGASAEDDHK